MEVVMGQAAITKVSSSNDLPGNAPEEEKLDCPDCEGGDSNSSWTIRHRADRGKLLDLWRYGEDIVLVFLPSARRKLYAPGTIFLSISPLGGFFILWYNKGAV